MFYRGCDGWNDSLVLHPLRGSGASRAHARFLGRLYGLGASEHRTEVLCILSHVLSPASTSGFEVGIEALCNVYSC